MARIFSSLALLAFSLLALNLALGFSTGDYNAAANQYKEAQRRAMTAPPETREAARRELGALAIDLLPSVRRAHLHMWVGVAAALVNLLVNSITVTYFIGTTRWCREVAETYHLDLDYVRRSNALKRRTFPCALGAILVILGIVALGAASDPSAGVPDSSAWVTPHYMAALVGVGLIGWSFLVQARNLAANYRIIQEIVAEVQVIRQKHGLAVE